MTQTLIVVFIVAVVVILAIALIVALTRRSSRLRPLPAESRDRFARTWSNIESRFIEDPRAAVQEADRAVVLILSERGATMPDGRGDRDERRTDRSASGRARADAYQSRGDGSDRCRSAERPEGHLTSPAG
ncbi:MAG: hypothetical protein E6I17_05390 [Chloroflexi bacterium]|nr:MAG: hypothetical protein E6I17_05390 [Chloroflexota bacterium]